MAVLNAPAAPTHDIGDTRFTSLATPSRGSTDNAVWIVEIDPGVAAPPHSLTREEIFVVLEGRAEVTQAGRVSVAEASDAIVVPAGEDFAVRNAGEARLRMLCCLPAGGQARLADGTVLTPPWSL